jgi:hypothetical protein
MRADLREQKRGPPRHSPLRYAPHKIADRTPGLIAPNDGQRERGDEGAGSDSRYQRDARRELIATYRASRELAFAIRDPACVNAIRY